MSTPSPTPAPAAKKQPPSAASRYFFVLLLGLVMGAIAALWEGLRAIPPESLGDTLLLANDLAPVSSPLNESPAAIAVRAARAAGSIDCVIGDATLSSIMEESDDEVQSLLKELVH